MNHPIQPLVYDASGVLRFKRNEIVDHLLNFGSRRGCGLNELAGMDFPAEDRIQFAQLIGYSLAGFSELSYVDDDTYRAATLMTDESMRETEARIRSLQEELDALRAALREPMARLFGVHPDDLNDRRAGG